MGVMSGKKRLWKEVGRKGGVRRVSRVSQVRKESSREVDREDGRMGREDVLLRGGD